MNIFKLNRFQSSLKLWNVVLIKCRRPMIVTEMQCKFKFKTCSAEYVQNEFVIWLRSRDHLLQNGIPHDQSWAGTTASLRGNWKEIFAKRRWSEKKLSAKYENFWPPAYYVSSLFNFKLALLSLNISQNFHFMGHILLFIFMSPLLLILLISFFLKFTFLVKVSQFGW